MGAISSFFSAWYPTEQEEEDKLQRDGSQTPTLSEVFTHEKGGVLEVSDADVKLTVPPRAVPKGKTYKINCFIHTNLADFRKSIQNDEIIVGPVVEMNVEGGGDFEVPVITQVPHCVPAGKVDDIRAWYGTGEHFEEIKKDKKSIEFKTDECFVKISSTHFTKFILTICKSITIDELLLTVSAPSDSQLKYVELRLALHTLVSMLKAYRKERAEINDPGMEEIKTMKVTLPATDRKVHFPKIELIIDIAEDSSWEVQKPAKANQVTIEGKNVMTANVRGLRSQQLRNIIVQNTCDNSMALDCRITYAFSYRESEMYISDSMAVRWPAASQQTFAHTKRSTSQERLEEDKPLWDPSHPDSQTFTISSELGDKLTKAAPKLKVIVSTADLWAHLQRYEVMGSADVERCKLAGVEADQVERLIDFLKKKEVWKTHGFFRSLAKTNQAGWIDVVLGPNGQTPYTRNLMD